MVASAIGIALALIIDWFPTDAAKQAGPIDTLYDVLMIISVPVFVLVVCATLLSVWQFRMRPGQERQDGPPIHGNTRLEIVWTAIPAIVLVSLCSYAYTVLTDIEEKKPNTLTVNVTGQQFAWRYAYDQDGRTIETTQLVLPKDRPVLFKVRALDVIHDFWVPAFRVKIDAVPGIVTEVRATPTKTGTFEVVCAELCGLGHAVMRSTARVVTPAAYDSWIAEQVRGGSAGGGAAGGGDSGGGASGGGGDAAALGRETFVSNCGSCHTLADAGTNGSAGPDLTTALRGQSEDEIREDIVDPDKRVEEGYQPGVMPSNFSQTLSSEQIDGLVTYLASVSR
ncbi:cytochrome c oxidase subunit II [Conexibacter sp. JD483]|uniref:cytochrome c oxidase subunit II n=1 Tax=unclassified Conexibacter TaxID=2627773 RepID=UPI0027166E41|nr:MULTISPECIES: cytochrome c oxidase subunit II [unclassified Conexibacter]MDO8187525.1 cytochrome c oxidase subunit II [Conexibacter sp. CPCC 205706]MDO8199232.1 cytochrome c oxidase subunit II [Conexibacter sp. CPCC 205762]MDR9369563.1 cytochrome c oxidase subunit II [Conexibacter sp. JD483]